MGNSTQSGGVEIDRQFLFYRPADAFRIDRRRNRLRARPGCQDLPPVRFRSRRQRTGRLGPFVDIVLARNTGISYGLFQNQGPLGQWILLGFKAVAVLLLVLWLARAQDRLIALSLGLIIGGAIGNAIDRLAYGWVADFVFFHISTANWRFDWYVFNLADVAIVAGVIGLLYESLVMDRAAKAP